MNKIKSLFIIIICNLFLFCFGCTSHIKKACLHTSIAFDHADKFYEILNKMHEEYPELITKEHLDELTILKNKILVLSDAICIYDELISRELK